MYMYIHVYIYIYIHIYMYTHTHTHTHTHTCLLGIKRLRPHVETLQQTDKIGRITAESR